MLLVDFDGTLSFVSVNNKGDIFFSNSPADAATVESINELKQLAKEIKRPVIPVEVTFKEVSLI
jgi:hypothetical protein